MRPRVGSRGSALANDSFYLPLRASMRPRVGSRGSLALFLIRKMGLIASMRPRVGSRGSKTVWNRNPKSNTCFNEAPSWFSGKSR